MLLGRGGEEGRRGFSVEESSLRPLRRPFVRVPPRTLAEVLPGSIPWVQLLRGRPVSAEGCIRSRWQLPDLNG